MPDKGMVMDEANPAKPKRFQFTLRQLLILVTLVACVLGVGRWWYCRPIQLTANDKLADYDGKRVALTGIVGGAGCDPECGDWIDVKVGDVDRRCFLAGGRLPPEIGQNVVVTGTAEVVLRRSLLDRDPPTVLVNATWERPTWPF